MTTPFGNFQLVFHPFTICSLVLLPDVWRAGDGIGDDWEGLFIFIFLLHIHIFYHFQFFTDFPAHNIRIQLNLMDSNRSHPSSSSSHSKFKHNKCTATSHSYNADRTIVLPICWCLCLCCRTKWNGACSNPMSVIYSRACRVAWYPKPDPSAASQQPPGRNMICYFSNGIKQHWFITSHHMCWLCYLSIPSHHIWHGRGKLVGGGCGRLFCL